MASRNANHEKVSPVRPLPAATLTPADRDSAMRLVSLLVGPGMGRSRFRLSRADGAAVDLTPSMITVLEAAAGMVAGGAGVAVLATDGDLSSQQAADVLGVSRQYMVRLLDRGDIPSFKVGSHRRVSAEDLAAYRGSRDRERRSALAMMTSDAQAAGGYDAPAKFGPRRQRQ